eukprot:gene4337-324_t
MDCTTNLCRRICRHRKQMRPRKFGRCVRKMLRKAFRVTMRFFFGGRVNERKLRDAVLTILQWASKSWISINSVVSRRRAGVLQDD